MSELLPPKTIITMQELINKPCELCGKSKIMYKYLFDPYFATCYATIPPTAADYKAYMYLCGACKRAENKLSHTKNLRDSPYRTKKWLTPLPDDIEIIFVTDLSSVVASALNPSHYGELSSCRGIREVFAPIKKAINKSVYNW